MKRYKYRIIEYGYTSMTYSEGKEKIEVCKTLHKTNSKLFFYLLILCFKINGIKYEVV
ncbi:MAG: hypothetical protein J6T10_21595 [Methanobrevibacter sp.]|nr:hypothetical protein [Methanobrevibacter sp.]